MLYVAASRALSRCKHLPRTDVWSRTMPPRSPHTIQSIVFHCTSCGRSPGGDISENQSDLFSQRNVVEP